MITSTEDHFGPLNTVIYIDGSGNVSTFALGAIDTFFQSTGGGGAPIFAKPTITKLLTGANVVYFGSNSNVVTELPLDLIGKVLKAQGVSAAPVFAFVQLTEIDGGIWKVIFTDGSGDVNELALGVLNSVLTSSGPASAPTYRPHPLVKGAIDGFRLLFDTAFVVDIEPGEAADSTNIFELISGSTISVDRQVVGPGGRQTGTTIGADTWVKVLVIGDTTGANAVDGLMVPVGTAFNESGYDVFRRVGYVRMGPITDILDFRMTGFGNYRTVMWANALANRAVLVGGAATTATAIDCSSLIPPTSELGHLLLEQAGPPVVSFRLSVAGAIFDQLDGQSIAEIISVDSSQQIFYENGTPGPPGVVNINVRGYVDEI